MPYRFFSKNPLFIAALLLAAASCNNNKQEKQDRYDHFCIQISAICADHDSNVETDRIEAEIRMSENLEIVLDIVNDSLLQKNQKQELVNSFLDSYNRWHEVSRTDTGFVYSKYYTYDFTDSYQLMHLSYYSTPDNREFLSIASPKKFIAGSDTIINCDIYLGAETIFTPDSKTEDDNNIYYSYLLNDDIKNTLRVNCENGLCFYCEEESEPAAILNIEGLIDIFDFTAAE